METQPASRPSRRAPLIGAALALTVGLTAGGLLRSGSLFDGASTAVAATAPQTADDGVVTFMTDAGGRIPDYVVGTDVTVGRADAGFQQAAYDPSTVDTTPLNDWSTAPPSIGGDILAMGESTGAKPAYASSTPSADVHGIDASEVAASGMTARADRTPAADTAPEPSAADRRDGQAALAAAGFSTP